VRGRELGLAVREVNLGQRLCQRQQARRAAHLVGQEVNRLLGPGVDGAAHQLEQPVVRQALGQRVDGHEAARVELVAVERLEVGVAHGHHPAVAVHLAAERVGVNRVELLFDERVEPRHLHLAGPVAHDGGDHLAVVPDGPALDAPDRADDGDFFAPLQPVDGLQLAVVVITVGQQVEQIAHSLDAQPGQLLRKAGADAGQARDGCIQAQAGCGRLAGGRTRRFAALRLRCARRALARGCAHRRHRRGRVRRFSAQWHRCGGCGLAEGGHERLARPGRRAGALRRRRGRAAGFGALSRRAGVCDGRRLRRAGRAARDLVRAADDLLQDAFTRGGVINCRVAEQQGNNLVDGRGVARFGAGI